ncbi:hypothetical protein DFJ74DRAFT_644472 [Hyaloraphidium curvatum]|nr:hypothetical protein DFJ74DRAFT_644472 [Hyaloraphidium curvatum]
MQGGLREWKHAVVATGCIILLVFTTYSGRPYEVSEPMASMEMPSAFVRYVPSLWERNWAEYVGATNTTDPCRRLQEATEQERVRAYLASAGAINNGLRPIHTENTDEDIILSKLIYRRADGSKYARFLEPLIGGLRHPDMCLPGQVEQNANRSFIIYDWRANGQESFKTGNKSCSDQVFYFDMGASTWASGGGGPSISWFYEIYRDRGLKFSRMFLWEAGKLDPVPLFAQFPEDVRPFVHYYNIPVDRESNGMFNSFNAILATATEKDYVVVKLDIDNAAVEDAVASQLMGSPQLASLVDEFYYEHHTNYNPMAQRWGCDERCPRLSVSYNIFTKLRGLGIRAHSWT